MLHGVHSTVLHHASMQARQLSCCRFACNVIHMLQGDRNNPYLVIERHLTPEVLAGCERFWRWVLSLHSALHAGWPPPGDVSLNPAACCC
jgi:hypothetical protein